MELFEYIEKFSKRIKFNPTKTYLILANVVLVSFAIWFANVGLLPFKNAGDFAFFVVLALILGLYRPGWTFLFFVGTLALENINLAPKELGLALRPYQFFGLITIIALSVQAASKRLAFAPPKLRWYDSLPIIFVVSGFLSSLGAIDKGTSFKQALVALSFVALYFLTRIYIQSIEDSKRTLPFFLSSGLVVVIYAVWQNVRFLSGADSFEVMPGRPNGTFTEPDWLGIYLTFLLGVVFAMIYYFNENSDKISSLISNLKFKISNKISISNDQIRKIFINITLYLSLVLIFVALILTVSRSAWIGAVFVVIVFLKSVLLGYHIESADGSQSRWGSLLETLKIQNWRWKVAGLQFVYVLASLGVSLFLVRAVPLTKFQLANRAASTGGLQKITVACNRDEIAPQKIKDVSELEKYGCRHINLEDIEKEKVAGSDISEIFRPDPNVNIRADIYRKSIAEIEAHPIFGIGWGSISKILGTDERGAGLNASNIFLEVWLGGGLLGIISFVTLLGYVIIASIAAFLDKQKKGMTVVFVMLGWVAIVIPNLFNSGIFLGLVWIYVAVAVGLLAEKKTR